MGIAVIRSFRSLATEMLDAADCPLSGKDWAERTLVQPSLATAEKSTILTVRF